MSLEKVAGIISRVFDFPLLAIVLLIAALFNTGLSTTQIKTLATYLVVLDIVFPIALFLVLLRKGKLSDIDITIRQERYWLFGLATITFLISTIMVYYLANYQFFILNLTLFLVALTLFIITLRWKISGHLIMNCSAIFIINYLFDWRFLWLFLIIPLVAFARFYLRKHTIPQIVAGAILGLAEPYLILKLFKLL